MGLSQPLDDQNTPPGCVFASADQDGNAAPPGPEDVKHFDILDFVRAQENEPQPLGADSEPDEYAKE